MLLRFNKLLIDIRYLSIIFALFGIVFAYSYFYVYHIFMCVFLCLFFFRNSISIENIRFLLGSIIFLIYIFLSIFWGRNINNSLRHFFYFICGITLIWIILDYVNNINKLNKIFNTFCHIMLLQLYIGLFEAFNFIRLPMSPFSSYHSYFGREGIDKNDFFLDQLDVLYSLPTGFTGNPNNFSFIILLSLPFIIIFIKNYIYKMVVLFSVLYIIFISDSRGLLLCYFLMWIFTLVLYIMKNNRRKSTLFLTISMLCIFFIVIYSLEDKLQEILQEILLLFDFIKYGNVVDFDSTGARSYIYREGFFQFLNNPWFGKGIGGMQYHLVEYNFPVGSFHYFPFELLIDIGLIPFTIITFMYIRLLLKLFKLYLKGINYYSNLSYACLVSLMLYPIASVVPSSTVYILPFWFILGFALVLVKVSKNDQDSIFGKCL